MIDQPAIQNLDYLRQLIFEARAAQPQDENRLRMLNGYGMGTDAVTVKQGDRQ